MELVYRLLRPRHSRTVRLTAGDHQAMTTLGSDLLGYGTASTRRPVRARVCLPAGRRVRMRPGDLDDNVTTPCVACSGVTQFQALANQTGKSSYPCLIHNARILVLT